MKIGAFRFNSRELLGSFGDIGILLPILIALVAINGINPFWAMLGIGLLYLGSGFYYKIPIPVQPLKALAAIAIISHASAQTIAAGALWMSLILFCVAYFNLTPLLKRLFPKPIIRGIQLGVGLILIRNGIKFIMGFSYLNEPLAPINDLSLGIISIPSWETFKLAFFLLVIPQLPLTFGNALIASEDTARHYYGDRAERVKAKNLSISLGLANLLAGLTAGLPVCHGSGGITAHYKFGARTGGATIMLGLIFLTLAFGFSAEAMRIFAAVPLPLLGVFLCYVGFYHCLILRDLSRWPEIFFAFIIGVFGAFFTNLAIAFMLGVCLRYILMGLHYSSLIYRRLLVDKKGIIRR